MTKNQITRRVLRGVNRDTRAVILEAVDHGWTVRITAGGHVQLRHPSGAIVIAACSSSDRRSLLALRADIRRVERTTQTGIT